MDVIEKVDKMETKLTHKKGKKIGPQEIETLCIIRIRGAHGMNRKIQNTLHLLNLMKVNNATIVRTNPSIRGMIQKVKDYVAFGPISVESLNNLLKKRAILTGQKPLTDDHVRSATVYSSVFDLAKAIQEGKIRLKEVKDLKPIFRLHPPRGGFPGSIKKAIQAGGSLGNIGADNMAKFLKKMT